MFMFSTIKHVVKQSITQFNWEAVFNVKLGDNLPLLYFFIFYQLGKYFKQPTAKQTQQIMMLPLVSHPNLHELQDMWIGENLMA